MYSSSLCQRWGLSLSLELLDQKLFQYIEDYSTGKCPRELSCSSQSSAIPHSKQSFGTVVLENHEVADDDVEPALKRQRIEINCQDPSIKSFLYSINQTICLRLDSIEAKLLALEATCKSLEEKLDLVMNKQHSPIQVPMVAGSPLGATQTCNKVRCWHEAAGGGRSHLSQRSKLICVPIEVVENPWRIKPGLGTGGFGVTCGSWDLMNSLEMRVVSKKKQIAAPVSPSANAVGERNIVVPQTTVILNNDRQNSIVAKMVGQEEPLSRAADSLENILSDFHTLHLHLQGVIRSQQMNKFLAAQLSIPLQDLERHTDPGKQREGNAANCRALGCVLRLPPYSTFPQMCVSEDYPNGTWLGDENNPEMRVRCPITPADMLHISTNCRTAEKMALTLLDYLFHREIQAISNLSGQGKHGKKQLDPLMIYGIRCHLFYKFGITESDWYRIKQSIDSKCRTAWRRKQRGQSLAVKSFSRRTPSSSSYSGSEGSQSSVSASSELQQNQPQALHYALANAQQVQIHQIGEDGQVQVGHLHIAQVPQGEQVQITQDSEGNLQIHQVHVGQDGQ
ncbi:hypothetical protein IHE44_0002488, partial [Lamprotornis superbus]